jgi:hypothetical protein
MAGWAAVLQAPCSGEAALWIESHPEEKAVVSRFVGLMITELAANDGKGNRPGWLTMDRKTALAEVHWHAAKLAVAAKEADADRIDHEDLVVALNNVSRVREYAADVANCALMVLDCLGLLADPQDQEGN